MPIQSHFEKFQEPINIDILTYSRGKMLLPTYEFVSFILDDLYSLSLTLYLYRQLIS